MSLELPKTKIAPLSQDPKNLILFGLPKVGKTTILSTLDNCLILDFEEGSDYVEALKIKIDSMKTLSEVCKKIKSEGCPYDFIAIDTVTALEEFVKDYALTLWKNSPLFTTKYEVKDIAQVPQGAGYVFWREAIETVINTVSKVCKHVIVVGHVKETTKEDTDGSLKELDLVGKTKRVLASKSDAIGFVHRDDDSNLCINFGFGGDIATGARPVHLANQNIIVAEKQEDGSFVSHWDRIYPSLKK